MCECVCLILLLYHTTVLHYSKIQFVHLPGYDARALGVVSVHCFAAAMMCVVVRALLLGCYGVLSGCQGIDIVCMVVRAFF